VAIEFGMCRSGRIGGGVGHDRKGQAPGISGRQMPSLVTVAAEAIKRAMGMSA
jgi:hypothetical protein